MGLFSASGLDVTSGAGNLSFTNIQTSTPKTEAAIPKIPQGGTGSTGKVPVGGAGGEEVPSRLGNATKQTGMLTK